ncbi:MAG: hypothetical protein KQH63_18740 [Desulfobulbaceae bacterium]|nr:hypothetical protein [Desulfobulbaceae bacterium]
MIGLLSQIRKNFSVTIILILTLVMIVMAAFFDFILIRVQQKSYEEQILQNGLSLVNMVADTVKLEVFAEDVEGLQGPVQAILKQKDVKEIAIFNAEGKRITGGKNDTSGPSFYVNKEIKGLIEQVDQGDESWQTEENFVFMVPVFFEFEGVDALYFEELSSTQQELIGYISLVFSKEGFKNKIARILVRTVVIVGLFLIFGIIFISMLINRMTRPLRQLLAKVSTMSAETEGVSDFHMLETTFDSIIAQLDQSFQTINEFKEDLEDKVAERTHELLLSNKDLARHKKSLEESNHRLFEALDDLHAAQKQIVQSEKMAAIGQIVAGVAHEINNTINFVSGALPSLKRSLHDAKEIITEYGKFDVCHDKESCEKRIEQIENLKKEIEYDELFETIDLLLANIEEGTSRTVRIVKDLKTFSRDEEEETSAVDLHEIIESSIKFMDNKKGNKVEIQKMYGDIPLVDCIPDRIGQVFLNLMNNSVQAMDGKGTLKIRTWQDHDNIHISFADTGCGISKENMPRIFDPFFTNKEVGKGTGLGLGISYTIIKKHGGDIEVESEEGKGAEFEVVLPKKPL